MSTTDAWWGDTALKPGALRTWQIGPYRLWVRAEAREWRLWSLSSDEAMVGGIRVAEEGNDDEVPDGAALTRVGLAQRDPVLTLLPAPADRDVVVRPDLPVVVPAGVRVELYVTTPLWVVARAGRDGPTLLDEPSHRMSDTWFGPNTLEGELAYALRTSATLDLEALPYVSHRAITRVSVVNAARDAFSLVKLKVPVAGLALYDVPGSGIWTDAVTLEREQASDEAEVVVGNGPGAATARPERIAEPRLAGRGPRFSLDAFGRLLGM